MIATEEAIVADPEVLIENDTDLDACDAVNLSWADFRFRNFTIL